MNNLDKFTRAYIECALWASYDDDDKPLCENYWIDDIHKDTLTRMIDDCARFQNEQSLSLANIPPEQAGHDFWLSRNEHGAGYFDRDYEWADHLQEAAQAYGSVSLYVDNGIIYSV